MRMDRGHTTPAPYRLLGQHREGDLLVAAGFQLSLAVELSCCDSLMLLPGLGDAELLLQG